MLPLNNGQSQQLSYKYQKILTQETWKTQFDFTSNCDSYSLEQSQVSPSTEQCQQKSQSRGCLDELKSVVDTMIPRKKCKGLSRPFSRLEDELILHLVDQFGPKFRKFVKFFSGRQATILKNRFYKCLRSEHLQDKEEAARRKEKTVQEKEIRNSNQLKTQLIREQQLIHQSLRESKLSMETEDIMGRCIDNLFTIFQNMYQ